MSAKAWFRDRLDACRRNESGAVSAEFMIAFPVILMIMFAAIDVGVTNMRQVFLSRAVDLSVREVRLGNVSNSVRLSELICSQTSMLPNCLQNITVEMRPIDTSTFDGLDDPFQCVNIEDEIRPAVTFIPGAGAQELMLIRVCVAAEPFLRITGMVNDMPVNGSNQYVIVNTSVFVNEPR